MLIKYVFLIYSFIKLKGKKMVENEFKIANDPETSQDVLEKLSKHKDEHIRAAVAMNSKTRKETLLVLTKDESDYVKETLLLREKI